jgi:drug/metabolite transporter (DMT)-like permease
MSDTSTSNRRSMIFMVLAMALFAANDAGTKYAVREIPVTEVMFIRGVFALLFLAVVLWWRDELRDTPKMLDWEVSLRGFAEAANGVLLISALALIPLGNVITIIQLVPFLMTVIGALMLGERVGWRRWLAVAAGFLGVIFVVKPATGAFDAASLFAVAATFTILSRDLLARSIGLRVPAFIVALASVLAGIVIGVGGAYFQAWQMPHAAVLLSCLASGICLVLAQYFIVLAYHRHRTLRGRSTSLFDRGLCGLVRLRFLPAKFRTRWSLTGMAIMIAAGLYMLHREALRSRGERKRQRINPA